MDCVFKRYSSPYSLIDDVIQNQQLCDFLDAFQEQKEEDQMWEFYLHKLPDYDNRTFEEFKESCKPQQTEKQTAEELNEIITNSEDVLQNFDPTKRGD